MFMPKCFQKQKQKMPIDDTSASVRHLQPDDEESVDSSREDSDIEKPENASKNDEIIIARAETKALLWWKMVVMAVLLLSALVVALSVYKYTTNSETSVFEEQFKHDAMKVFESIGSTLDMSLGSIDSFLVSVSSFATYANMTYPFVTIVSNQNQVDEGTPCFLSSSHIHFH